MTIQLVSNKQGKKIVLLVVFYICSCDVSSFFSSCLVCARRNLKMCCALFFAERLDVEEAEAPAKEDEDAGIIRRIPETTKNWP